MAHDIAIVGLSFKLPQGVDDPSAFWEILSRRRNLMSQWPDERVNLDSFYTEDGSRSNKLHSKGSHFLAEDPGVFDAPFFSITAREAAAMDPQQRWALETTYHAFENAGIPVQSLKGSRTAVYAASMSDEYTRMLAKDPDTAPPQSVIGTSPSTLPNRLSWYFDLVGPSIHIDTACSGSMVGLDLAVQALRGDEATMAVVCSPNLILGPEGSVLVSNLNFLSPDSVCYSFDQRANGYSRGEGVIAVVLKRVLDAVRDGDNIRAVIRSSGTNQDGRTVTLTQPSSNSQEALIRNVYEKAGLDFSLTHYVEAHGTGTPMGDPIELNALGQVFGSVHSPIKPLYVGSVKSNIGHLEGCSGLAGIVKAIMILERGIIPPNALFETVNPDIDVDKLRITIPIKNTAWPTNGLRRVSVNSFGFGGTNSHVVLDDAYHYLGERRISGNHCTIPTPTHLDINIYDGLLGAPTHAKVHKLLPNDYTQRNRTSLPSNPEDVSFPGANAQVSSPLPYLLIFSAADEMAMARVTDQYNAYYSDKAPWKSSALRQLAHTLCSRRSEMLWRTFAIVEDNQDKALVVAKAMRAGVNMSSPVFIFTGQGAQYVNMGIDLLRYPQFMETMRRATIVCQSLGCDWDMTDVLCDPVRVDQPEYCQPLCTALQMALVHLLATFNIRPRVVIGHSSGEIAAAYTSGALSFASALKVAYFRGKLSANLSRKLLRPGAMLSVNLPESQVHVYLAKHGLENDIHIACINSPFNCTLSGSEAAIDSMKGLLDRDEMFSRKLRTGVAYHSPDMHVIAREYHDRIQPLLPGTDLELTSPVEMISSVNGQVISVAKLGMPEYWVENLVSPVRFSSAVHALQRDIMTFRHGGPPQKMTDIIEIGPHAALRRPVLDTLRHHIPVRQERVRYMSTLDRSKPGVKSMLELAGQLFMLGHPISVIKANTLLWDQGTPPVLVDCPPYPFDHSQRYWSESRLSRDYRLRENVSSQLLGERFYDCNPLEPRWRNLWSIDSMPWVADHIVTGVIVLPGTSLIVMAIEASKRLLAPTREATGYLVTDAQFLAPVAISRSSESPEKTETMLRLQPVQVAYDKESLSSTVTIFSRHEGRWAECFRANIKVQCHEPSDPIGGSKERQLSQAHLVKEHARRKESCTIPVDSRTFYAHFKEHGIEYGATFQGLENIHWNGNEAAVADFLISDSLHGINDTVHPAVLDSACQLVLVQGSGGATHTSPTSIPSCMNNVWISAAGWKSSNTKTVHLSSTAKYRPGGRSAEADIHVFADDDSLLCSFTSLILTPVSKQMAEDIPAKTLIHGLEWKPQLSLLGAMELRNICNPVSVTQDETFMSLYRGKLDFLLQKVMRNVTADLTAEDRDRVPSDLVNYLVWIDDYLRTSPSNIGSSATDDQDLEALIREVEDLHPPWKLFPTIARNLKRILCGQVDPLSLLFETGLAETLYADVFHSRFSFALRAYLDLASHENPNLRVLEVGAGTGSMTQHMLAILQDLEMRSGSSKFAKYTYTDISPAFFENAKFRFENEATENRLDFIKFDVEQDAAKQGLQEGEFDVIVAANVLHATANLSSTLRHIHQLLRPGGKLLFVEVIAKDRPTMNFGFGTLPGWWKYMEAWREQGPLLSESRWDSLLRENGFTGNDLCFRDFQSPDCHLSSIIATTTIGNHHDRKPEGRLLIVVSLHEPTGPQMALGALIKERLGQPSVVLSLDQLMSIDSLEEDIVISLVETHTPFLATMTRTQFEMLRVLIRRASKLLWASCANISDDAYAYYGLTNGFLRTVRSEATEKHIVALAIEQNGPNLDEQAAYIIDAIKCSFEDDSKETELIVRDGKIMTARAVERKAVNETVQTLIAPQLTYEQWSPGSALKLGLKAPGMLDTLEYLEDHTHGRVLGPQEVEVEMRAWGVSFRDVFVALGRIEDDDLGYDGSGVVTRIGPECEHIRLGDRVCMISPSCMRSHAITHEALCAVIPGSVSFIEAASIVAPGVTAYHSLVVVGRLRKNEKILIHSASGSTGQMAIWVAQMVGAEVFATVGYREKKALLTDYFKIPEDHIFYSRDMTFKAGVMRMTDGYGVDMVLNSLSGDGLRTSWECLAPLGRFIELGKTDIMLNSSLPMANFAGNISFMAVDLHHLAHKHPNLVHEALTQTIQLVLDGTARFPHPLHVFATSQVESAFRYLQSGKNTGRIVIALKDDDVVPKRLLRGSTWKFDENSTYIIAGGTGGLGRGIARWMVQKGARNLVLPSRSGSSSKAGYQLLSELRHQGIHIIAPQCDVSSESSLAELLVQCSESMPPIRGCINAAMVLQDAILDNMTYDQWSLTISSKVQTSWNLHKLLPKSLDFFILLSSLSGIYGSPSQANYASGCTFQDSLSRYRIRHGLKAISCDIGWLRNIGIISENEVYQRNRIRTGDMGQIEDIELMAVLDFYCDPNHHARSEDDSQALIGATTPRDALLKGQDVHPVLQVPLFSGFRQIAGDAEMRGGDTSIDPATQFRGSANTQEQAEVVVQTLLRKLSVSLSISPDDIDINKALSDYGVDSLMAVELRNWIAKAFHANVAVFEIMGGRQIAEIGSLVVGKSDLISSEGRGHQ